MDEELSTICLAAVDALEVLRDRAFFYEGWGGGEGPGGIWEAPF